MCGIAGWINWNADLRDAGATVNSMADTLQYRGPDAAGAWLSQHAALAHRRLTVIDPEGGGQPMVRRIGGDTYVITYNGELYNTAEISRDLKGRGYRIRSHSDTEALLLAFIEWGMECVDKLNGIFAFGIWSERDQRLFLARDRLGVKPLFYARRSDGLLFGSEIKALLAHPQIEAEVDAEGLAEIFAIGPARTPGHGVYRGVNELKPGHALVCDRNGSRAYRYWSLQSHPHEDDLETTAARVRCLLQDSVERQLISDVPVCTLLSGGLDSSALSAFASRTFQREGRGTLHTYSVDYVGNEKYFRPSAFQPNSDAPWVRLVSEYLGTRHHYVTITTEQLVSSLQEAVRARDLPGMADVDWSLYLFCREIKKDATVALSGECADEVFGGYPWFHREDARTADTFPWSRATHERERWLSPELRRAIRPQEYVADRYRETLTDVPEMAGESPHEKRTREIFYLNFTWFMVTLLNRKDRMSMASGLEVRVPFCDHRLVEYAWNIPWSIKACDDREKGILRRALAGVLPDEVLDRRKSPYPKTHNPGYLEAMRRWVLRILDDPGSPLLPLIDVKAIRAMAQAEDDTFDQPWFGQLMTGPQLFAYLAEIDTWLREYNVKVRLS